VTDTQMPRVASVILPEMYKIFTQENVSHILYICYQIHILCTQGCKNGKDLECLPSLSLPYLTFQGGQTVIPAQCWDCISSAQCTSVNVTHKVTGNGYEAIYKRAW